MARRAAGGNMLAATVTGPIATIAARTWTLRRNLVTPVTVGGPRILQKWR
jgi:hypothetical protein